MLAEPLYNRGHCITTDNFFTSLKLANFLLTKKTTLIGTMKKYKRELPSVVNKVMPLHHSLFWESKAGVVLTNYQCKPTKSVTVLSSEHEQVRVDAKYKKSAVEAPIDNPKKKPNIILDYNRTKCAIDSVDQMTRSCSVKYPTRRWPVQVWNNMLNLAGINAWVLYKEVNDKPNMSRRKFLTQLVEEIEAMLKPVEVTEHVKVNESSLFAPLAAASRTLNQSIQRKRKCPVTATNSVAKKVKQPQCQIKLCNKNKAFDICAECEKALCGRCVAVTPVKICKPCQKQING